MVYNEDMGLFDEFNDLLKDFRDIKDEMVDLAVDVVKEGREQADDIKDTVTGTADEFKSQAEDVQQTVTEKVTQLKSQAHGQASDIQARFRDAAGLSSPQKTSDDDTSDVSVTDEAEAA